MSGHNRSRGGGARGHRAGQRAVALLAAAGVAAVGCATNPSRPPLRPEPVEVPRTYLGAWVAIDRGAPAPRIEGELLAIDPWRVHVETLDGRWEHVDRGTIVEARVYEYGASTGAVAGGTLVGILSTVTHGVFLVISAPIWLIVGIASTSAESRHMRLMSPPADLEAFRPWARYPQGLPPQLP